MNGLTQSSRGGGGNYNSIPGLLSIIHTVLKSLTKTSTCRTLVRKCSLSFASARMTLRFLTRLSLGTLLK